MRVEVRFFGLVQEAAGTHHALIEIADGATVQSVAVAVREAIPALADLPAGARIRYAVNAEYADGTRKLLPGDVLSLIPPVGGG